MLRSKRQRSSHHNSGEQGSGGSDDELMRMNPSLMTERQQLAFLLRKTAQDASASESTQSSESSEDELIQSFGKGARRIQRNANSSSPRRSGAGNGSSSNGKSDGAVVYRGRGRPPKNAIKLPQCQHYADTKTLRGTLAENKSSSTAKGSKGDRKLADSEDENSPHAKRLKVTTAEDLASAAKGEKSSPSSSSDVLYMDTFESDFWSLHCALCCGKNASSSHGVSLSEALFLCPSCDRKYPTQRALGRV